MQSLLLHPESNKSAPMPWHKLTQWLSDSDLKISILVSISIRIFLKMSISIRTFLKISISIWGFQKIMILISISIMTFWVKNPFFSADSRYFHVLWWNIDINCQYIGIFRNNNEISTLFFENINIDKISIRKIWTYRYRWKYRYDHSWKYRYR